MVAQGVFSLGAPGLQLVGQLVGVTAAVGAGEHGGRAGADLDLGELALLVAGALRTIGAAGQRVLDGENFLAVPGQLGAELRRPVGEQLDAVGLEAFTLVVEVRGERIGAGGVGRVADRDAVALGQLVVEHHPLVVGDVEVDLGQPLLVFFEEDKVVERGVVHVVREAVQGVEGGLESGDVGRGGVAGGDRTIERGRAVGQRVGRLGLFVGHEEEQTVADDRTAEGRAPGLGLERVGVREAAEPVQLTCGGHALVGEFIEQRTPERVRARLGHGVQVAARELVVLDAVGRDVHFEGFKRVDRDRRTLRGVARGVEAEVVVLRDAVDGQAVKLRVRAGDDQRVAVGDFQRGERVQTGELFRVAGRARQDRQGGGAVAAAKALLRGRAVEGRGRDDQRFNRVRAVEHDVGFTGVADADGGDRELGGFQVRSRGADRVGAADAQAARVERALGVGHHRGGGAGRFVANNNGRVADRGPGFVGDAATDRSGCFLGVDRAGRCERENSDGCAAGEPVHELHV